MGSQFIANKHLKNTQTRFQIMQIKQQCTFPLTYKLGTIPVECRLMCKEHTLLEGLKLEKTF